MKKAQVKIGRRYIVKVSGRLVPVRIDGPSIYGGWNGTNTSTGRGIRIKTAARLRWEDTGKPKDRPTNRPSKKRQDREREVMTLQAACDLVAREETSLWSAEHPGVAGEANSIRRALYNQRPPLVRARRFVRSATVRDILSRIISRARTDIAKHDAKQDGVGDWIRSGSWYQMLCYAGEAVGIKVA